jgi:hypothetical protein
VISKNFQKLAKRLEDFPLLVDRCKLWFLVGFIIIYLLVTCAIASKRMLWNDEIFSLYISRLGGLSDILSVLATGADQHPPSFYLLTHVVLNLLGESHLAVRLPEILGVLLMSLCLFHFVSKRVSTIYGLAAMLFPLITIAYEYAYEARGYGLMLGFSSLALVCWQEATESQRRLLWLIGLSASGIAAISSHYYAILLLVPLGAGEFVRSLARKRIDLPIWVALIIMLLPLVLFFPVIQEARSYVHHFWSPPEWSMIPKFYYVLLIPALGPILAILIISAVWPDRKDWRQRSSEISPLLFSWHEITSAIGFIAIPAVAVLIGKFITGAFTWRYGLSAVIGFSILLPLAVQRLNGGRIIIGICFTVFMCVWFIVMGVIQLHHQAIINASWSKTYEFLQSEGDPRLPIVAGDLHTFMTLVHYAPPAIMSRVVYLANPQASIRYFGHDTVDRGILDLKPWFHVAVQNYAPFVNSHDRFLVYARVRGARTWLGYFWGAPWDWSWLLYELHEAPTRIELLGRNDDDLLFLVISQGQN